MTASYLRLVLQNLLATAAVQGKLPCPSLLLCARALPLLTAALVVYTGTLLGWQVGLLYLDTAAKTLLCETIPLFQQHQKQSSFRKASIKLKSQNYAKDLENHSKSSNSDFLFNNMIFRDAGTIAATTRL